MSVLLQFEDFSAPPQQPVPEPAAPAEDHPAYAAGFAAGEATARQETAQLDARLSETLTDMAFGYAEARQHLLQSLQPLFAAITDQLLPGAVEDSFRIRLLEHLTDIAAADSQQPVVLRVHPAQTEPVRRVCTGLAGIPVDIVEDPGLSTHAATLTTRSAESAVDCDRLIAAIAAALQAMTTPPKEAQAIG